MTARARAVSITLAVVVPVTTALLFGPEVRWLIIPASLMFVTIVVLSFVGGGGAGIIAAFTSTLALWFVCTPPGFSFVLTGRDDAIAVASAGSVAFVLALVTTRLRARERRAVERTGALEIARDADGETILALQQAALPTIVPEFDGVSIIANYHVGGELDSPVGGDWFAYLPLDAGRIGVAVGDVVGHGIEAVASMAEYRYTFRAIAADGVDPDVALNRLEDLNSRLGRPDVFTTCLYVIVDPAGGTLRLASAGHPPPLLIRGDSIRTLEGRNGPPVGLVPARDSYRAETFDVRVGDVVVLYTDGLVERPDELIDQGINRLGRAVADLLAATGGARCSPADLDPVIADLVGSVPRDDALLLLVRITAVPAGAGAG